MVQWHDPLGQQRVERPGVVFAVLEEGGGDPFGQAGLAWANLTTGKGGGGGGLTHASWSQTAQVPVDVPGAFGTGRNRRRGLIELWPPRAAGLRGTLARWRRSRALNAPLSGDCLRDLL